MDANKILYDALVMHAEQYPQVQQEIAQLRAGLKRHCARNMGTPQSHPDNFRKFTCDEGHEFWLRFDPATPRFAIHCPFCFGLPGEK